MFKLMFSTAMIAPVLIFALRGEMQSGDVFDAPDTSATLASAPFLVESNQPATCHSETLAVVFHDTFIESHSAQAVNDALEPREGCETSYLRVTALLPADSLEDSSDTAYDNARLRNGELAAHIEAAIGEHAAMALPIHTDFQSSAADQPLHHHALLRVERRPVTGNPSSAPAPVSVVSAAATATLN